MSQRAGVQLQKAPARSIRSWAQVATRGCRDVVFLLVSGGSQTARPDHMNPWRKKMIARSRQFAVDVIRFVRTLSVSREFDDLKRQLVNAATSAGDNYRSASRARSHAEFTSKLGTVLDEADEAESWLTVLWESGLCRSRECARLRAEAADLRAIFAKSTQTANENERRRNGGG